MVIDSLLKSLTPSEKGIDEKWVSLARRRLEELRAGKVITIAGDEVFRKR